VPAAGSGGACEIAALAKKRITIANSQAHPSRSASLRHQPGSCAAAASASRWAAGGPETVITDMGVYGFDPKTREMVLVSMHPGVTLAKIRENIAGT